MGGILPPPIKKKSAPPPMRVHLPKMQPPAVAVKTLPSRAAKEAAKAARVKARATAPKKKKSRKELPVFDDFDTLEESVGDGAPKGKSPPVTQRDLDKYRPRKNWVYRDRVPAKKRAPRTRRLRTNGYRECLCGCGAPVVDYFAKGHYARWAVMMQMFADGEILPYRVLPPKFFEALGPWVPTETGGVRPSKNYTVLRS